MSGTHSNEHALTSQPLRFATPSAAAHTQTSQAIDGTHIDNCARIECVLAFLPIGSGTGVVLSAVLH